MQILLFLISAIAMSSASIAFQIGLATGHFKSYEWAMWPLFGASALLWLTWIVLAIVHNRQQRQTPQTPSTPSPQQTQTTEQKVTQEIHIGQELLRQFRDEPKPEPAPKPEPPPQPNLVMGSIRCPQFHLVGDEFYSHVSDNLQDSFPQPRAIVAEIMNASKENEPVGSAHNIKAELIIHLQDRREIFGPLAWTETDCNTV